MFVDIGRYCHAAHLWLKWHPMPQSLLKLLVHIVFSTKDRMDLIDPAIEDELYKYIHGILKNNGARLIIGNGTANHSHLLTSIGKNDIPKLVGNVKRSTSAWLKTKGYNKFYWQNGYGAFSIGQSQVEDVSRYIREQKNITESSPTRTSSGHSAANTRSRSMKSIVGIKQNDEFTDPKQIWVANGEKY